MLRKSLVALILFNCYLSNSVSAIVLPDPTGLCGLFKDGTRLRKPGSCTEYIHCANSSGIVYSCPAQQLFDRKTQSCVTEENLSDVDKYCRNRCEGINGKWITDPFSCKGYLYCKNGEPLQGYCDNGYNFDETKAMCDFEDESSCYIVPEICDLVPDGTKYRNINDCAKYYECKNGKSSSSTCSKKHFNVQTNACGDQWIDDSCVPSAITCYANRTIIRGYFSDKATCRGYFICRDFGTEQDLEPVFRQCPVGKLFDQTTQSCVDPIDSDCQYNRCQGRGDMYIQTNEDNCRNYITCQGGFEVARKRCNGDKFFDEKSQGCVNAIISYKCCDGK